MSNNEIDDEAAHELRDVADDFESGKRDHKRPSNGETREWLEDFEEVRAIRCKKDTEGRNGRPREAAKNDRSCRKLEQPEGSGPRRRSVD